LTFFYSYNDKALSRVVEGIGPVKPGNLNFKVPHPTAMLKDEEQVIFRAFDKKAFIFRRNYIC